MSMAGALPQALASVVSDFAEMQGQDKLALLLEFAGELPPLPAELEEAAMEPVPECQSPLFLYVDAADREHVRLYFSAPPRRRRRVGSPRSWPPGSTITRPRRSCPCPTTSIPNSGWPH